MGVSFKISRAGRRFLCPIKPTVVSPTAAGEEEDAGAVVCSGISSGGSKNKKKLEVKVPDAVPEENEVSFTLSLFPDGYSIGRPSENHSSYQAMLHDVPKLLHPYDRTSEGLFSAIESGRLPGDILDDIPCKYVDGTLVCEVRDYRNGTSEKGSTASSTDGSPITNRVRLRMSLENVVKDIPLISDNTWTYGDLMEVESRILKALQPQLCLDPTPKLDRLCENSVSKKLNLDLRSLRRKRRREMPEVIVTSNNKFHGKKVCIDRVPESSSFRVGDVGPVSGSLAHGNAQNSGSSNLMLSRVTNFVPDSSVAAFVSQPSKYQMGPASNAPGASPGGQDMMIPYSENMNSVYGRRENQDGGQSSLPSVNKRARVTSSGPDGNQQQHMGAHMENLNASETQWKNTLLHQQTLGRGFQYANNGMQKFPQQMYEGGLNQEAGASTQFAAVTQQGMRYPKEEPVETERLDKSELYQNRNDMQMLEAERNRLQQRLPPQHAFMRSNFPQPPWNNFGQPTDNSLRKEDQYQKRKSVQSPRVSAGGLPQSPLSSKSGEFSSGSAGAQFGPVITSAIGSSHKDKTAITSVPLVGGGNSFTSSGNDNCMQRQQQAQLASKRRTNSLPKTPAMSGVGSPASVSNMSVPLNVSSPADEILSQVDSMMLDRFSKLEKMVVRHQINRKKNKVDEKPSRKPSNYPTQQLMQHLSNDFNGAEFPDDGTKDLSKSLVGGSTNACKIRIMNFVQNDRIMQGNGFIIIPKSRIRMVMCAKPNDGTIAMVYGELEEGDFLSSEDYFPTLPNAHLADLLAAQLSSLMLREGYEIDDNIVLKPNRANHAASNPQANAGMEMQQCSEAVSGQQSFSTEVAKPTNSGNQPLPSNQNVQSQRMVHPQNNQALQISQGFLPGGSGSVRPQQIDSQLPLQQQQPSQLQRSSFVLPSNQLPQMSGLGQNSNMLMGNQMVNKPSPLQIQMFQQQQQQQQPRKMMMGMGNMGNNMVGLGGLGNVMGMGGPRGIGVPANSGPMGPISGGGQNAMSLNPASNISNVLSHQIRTGQLTPQALVAAKMRMAQRNMLGGPQSSLSGISGARQMHPSGLSMLGHPINRAMPPMQRSPMGPMGPPKLITGMNLYMNQQLQQQQQQQQHTQQQQLQLQQQQIQQQQFQQQQMQQQQDSASPLQAVLSPPQQMSQQPQQQQQQASPQQMNHRTPMSPQQMGQRTPMSPQLSSGAMHSLNVGNPEACPASPQLSSQTLGSVSSIANSPMELQGVNKNGSASNG